jgi:hypothetical protein
VDKLVTRTKNATGDYSRGIDRVTEAPGAKAAAKKEKMRQGINAAIDSGRWERNVASVSLGDWKNAAKNKGAQRISAGLDEAKSKMVSTFQAILDHQDAILAKLENMPDLTPEQREERALFVMREMRKFRK